MKANKEKMPCSGETSNNPERKKKEKMQKLSRIKK